MIVQEGSLAIIIIDNITKVLCTEFESSVMSTFKLVAAKR